jgi:hypothetical protein
MHLWYVVMPFVSDSIDWRSDLRRNQIKSRHYKKTVPALEVCVAVYRLVILTQSKVRKKSGIKCDTQMRINNSISK